MIKPVGSDELQPLFVYDPDQHHELLREAKGLPSAVISSQAAGNAVMMGGGYFSPLKGYMTVADAVSVARTMKTADGMFFPVPVLCLLDKVDAIEGAGRIALRDPNLEENPILAVMDVERIETVSDEQMGLMTDKVYRTDDLKHPGVAAFNGQGRFAVSGPIQVLHFSLFPGRFPGHLPHCGGDSQRDRRARMEQNRRFPDPQPDAPGPRGAVPYGHGASGVRWPGHPHAAG